VDEVKIVEVGKGEEGISVFQLESVAASVPVKASDIAYASDIVRVVIDSLVVSSDCMNCDKIDGDGSVSPSRYCCCREPCDSNE
jgi:hypothetical protein